MSHLKFATITNFIIGVILFGVCYATEAIQLTEEQQQMIIKERCDLIENGLIIEHLDTILQLSDSTTKLLQNVIKKSSASIIDKQTIVQVTDCRLEIFLDSLKFSKTLNNLSKSNFKFVEHKYEAAMPKRINLDSTITDPRVRLQNVEHFIVSEYQKGQIIIRCADTHITVLSGSSKILNAKFIQVDIKPERYKQIKAK